MVPACNKSTPGSKIPFLLRYLVGSLEIVDVTVMAVLV